MGSTPVAAQSISRFYKDEITHKGTMVFFQQGSTYCSKARGAQDPRFNNAEDPRFNTPRFNNNRSPFSPQQ
jgi:hypothetical protein